MVSEGLYSNTLLLGSLLLLSGLDLPSRIVLHIGLVEIVLIVVDLVIGCVGLYLFGQVGLLLLNLRAVHIVLLLDVSSEEVLKGLLLLSLRGVRYLLHCGLLLSIGVSNKTIVVATIAAMVFVATIDACLPLNRRVVR